MSSADRSQYAEAVTNHSEGELREILGVAEPPISLLGGWAVHLHVTPGFEDTHGRSYIGSRDIDLGIPVDPKLSSEDLIESEVATTFDRIKSDLGYHRGRFGFYQQFHRETGERLDDEAARKEPPHNVFRVDIDILPDTSKLDAFHEAFGFRPPAEPLLKPVFADETGERLTDYVEWDVPEGMYIPPASFMAAMKVRSLPQRDKSHKRLKDLADLFGLLWYVSDYDEMRSSVKEILTENDLPRFASMATEDLIESTARLIDVEAITVEQSIRGLVD